jgi:hypothetical protein
MADSNYQPPTQSAIGQFFDSLFLLVLVLVALFAPLYMGLAGGGKTELAVADKSTWIGLGQNAVQQAQWEKLGFTPDSAASIITSRFDYTFSVVELAITAVVVIGYFLLLFKFSKTEYAEVIAERFKKK